MKIIKASAEIISPIDSDEILKAVELAGRTCYKSEEKITTDSARKFCASIIKNHHESVLEHRLVTVRFVVDRGVSHELVRHRIASFSQESTRFCNYGKAGEITFIEPCFWSESSTGCLLWVGAMRNAEETYLELLKRGATPQEARSVLPNSTKTEVVMTANLREWRHFFKLRAIGTQGKPHPQMLEVTVPLLEEFKRRIPVIFDGISK